MPERIMKEKNPDVRWHPFKVVVHNAMTMTEERKRKKCEARTNRGTGGYVLDIFATDVGWWWWHGALLFFFRFLAARSPAPRCR